MQMVLSVFSHVSSMPGEDAGDMGTLALRDPLLLSRRIPPAVARHVDAFVA